MPRPRAALILAAGYGAGHVQAGRALAEALAEVLPNVAVETIDYLDWMPRSIATGTLGLYRNLTRHWPTAYGWVYGTTAWLTHHPTWRRHVYHLGIHRLRRALAQARPDFVLCTHPLPMGALSLLRQAGFPVPLVGAVVTDFVLHPEWAQPHLDRYYVATADLAQELARYGIDLRRIEVTGIPVRRGFWHPPRREPAPSPSKPTVLFMTSALGTLGGVREMCEALFALPHPVRWVVVTGRDHRLRHRLGALGPRYPSAEVEVLGYLDGVAERMAAAELVITKAGGLTVSEALALGRPLLLVRPVPGQEAGNAAWLSRQGAAVVATDSADVAQKALALLKDPQRLAGLAQASARLGRPQAALDIARSMAQLAADRPARLGS
ncbi:MAG: glycosyltransferase [Firmicutes bacterium]|nr:glycosyltransferase [Alicyclobacillaceae bacterium]MCL6498068.1 glycosyltransferase [Bacillota bacterium]